MSEQKEEQGTVQETLDDFNWDNPSVASEFAIEPGQEGEDKLTNEEKAEIIEKKDEDGLQKKQEQPEGKEKPEVKPADEPDEKKEGAEEEDKKDEIISFEDKEDIEEEKKKGEEGVLKVLSKELKDKGVLSFVELPEEEEIEEEKFVQLFDDEVEARVQDTFEGFFEELDEDGKAFLKFKKEGGNTSEFFDMLRNTSGIPKGDIKDENYQKNMVRYYVQQVEGLDSEEADDRVEYLVEKGRLETYAGRYEEKVNKLNEDKQQTILDEAKKNKDKREKDNLNFRDGIKTTLDSNENIGGFTFNKKEKGELLDYVTKQGVKVGKNAYITQLQHDLRNLPKNPEKLIILAKLLRSDFDLGSMGVKATTQATRKLKEEIQRSKTNAKPRAASSTSGKKSLADWFDD